MKHIELIKNILREMYVNAQDARTMSPGWWIDKATLLNALRQNLVDDLITVEMACKKEKADLIEGGKKISEAKLIVEATSENYKLFKTLEAQHDIVKEQINLSKKREKIEEL